MTKRRTGKPGRLHVNQKVKIRVVAGVFKGNYSSRIEDCGEDYLVLAMPIKKRQLVPLPPGTRVWVHYLDEAGIYRFQTVVTDHRLSEPPNLTILAPEQVDRHQRRRYVRLDVRLPVEFGLLEGADAGDKAGDVLPLFRGWTADLSGGGMALVPEVELQPGSLMAFELKLPDGKPPLRGRGRVIRVKKGEGIPGLCLAGVEFCGISEQERDRIVRFIFKEERLRRKMGLV